ncbi:MAG: hypothetical protein AB1432_01625 [Bacteroidota bacterium]|jgi:hypothetical protein
MKKLITILFIFFILITYRGVNGQSTGFGIGLMVGEPTGISGKYWISNENAFDFGLAYSFVQKHSAVSIHADYLYHAFDVIKSDYRLPVYYGFGARIRFVNNSDNSLGARGVVGIAWLNDKLPIDIFFEVVPVFNLIPSTALNLDIALGARYYFK